MKGLVAINIQNPTKMKLIKGTPNPAGASDAALFLLVGDAAAAPVGQIIPEAGVSLPKQHHDLDGFRLKIAHFNDFHGRIAHLTPDGSEPLFSRLAVRLRQLRTDCSGDEKAALLVLSAGDDLVGSLFGEMIRTTPQTKRIHPAYRAYTAAGVDISGVGNHDLDPGMGLFTESLLRDARFPVLSANLIMRTEAVPAFYPAAILVTKGLRIGIVGLTTPAEDRKFNQAEFEIIDPLQACSNLLPALRPCCDVLIILSHLGLHLDSKTAPVAVTGDVELAQQLEPGLVDLIVGGHTHDELNPDGLENANIINQIPIVQAGAFGEFLGEVTLTRNNKFIVTGASLTETANLPPDDQIERQVVQPLVEILQPLRTRWLGQTADHPDVTDIAVDRQFADGECALANMITDALVERCRLNGFLIDCAMIDRTCLSAGLAPGDVLTFEDWYPLMPYLDNIQIFTLKKEDFVRFINDNTRRINGWNEPLEERGFAHFSKAVRYTIQPGEERAVSRALDLTVDGQLFAQQPDRKIRIATSSFFRGLCDEWEKNSTIAGLLAHKDSAWTVEGTRLFVRDEIVQYLVDHGGATSAAGVRRDGRVKVLPLDRVPSPSLAVNHQPT